MIGNHNAFRDKLLKKISSSARIIDSHLSTGVLLTLEALHIARKNPSINTRDEYRSKDLLQKF